MDGLNKRMEKKKSQTLRIRDMGFWDAAQSLSTYLQLPPFYFKSSPRGLIVVTYIHTLGEVFYDYFSPSLPILPLISEKKKKTTLVPSKTLMIRASDSAAHAKVSRGCNASK
jgi:hypothetical protein